MSKNCGHTVPCGCADKALVTPPPCDTSGECVGEPCSEIFCEECIAHCQETYQITIGGEIFTVTQGERLDDILQRLLIFMANPACAPTAAVGLGVLSKTSTTIKIAWTGSTTETYKIAYSDGVNPAGSITVAVGLLSQEITGLIPDTTYTIGILTVSSGCNSVEMLVKTKAT